MWHGARADGYFRGGRSRSRIRLDALALLGQRGVIASGPAAFHAWRIAWPAPDAHRSKWHRIPHCDAGGPLGRLALFRTLLVLARQPQPEYVHADWIGAGC